MSEEFECEECGKTFDSERGLKVHAAQVHDGSEEEKEKGTGVEDKRETTEFEAGPWKLVSGILAVLLVITLAYAAQGGFGAQQEGDTIPKEEAADEAMDFVNEYLVQEEGMEDLQAEEVNEKYGLYEVVIEVEGMMGPQEQSLYVTKDGEVLFPEGFNMDERAEEIESMQQAQEEQTATTNETMMENETTEG
ncbi:MAG: hypothetical protein ACLFTQ_03840 [Candidatus Aenigmatarchaeota archaeon]